MSGEVVRVVDVIHKLKPIDLAPLLVILHRGQVVHAIALIHLLPATDRPCFVTITPNGMLGEGGGVRRGVRVAHVWTATVLAV